MEPPKDPGPPAKPAGPATPAHTQTSSSKAKPEPPKSSPATDGGEEWVQADDAVIGRAFRLSVVVLIMLVAAGAVVLWMVKRKPASGPVQITPLSAPSAPQRPEAEVPAVTFINVTTEAGIGFVHVNGASGDKLLPETMGGGVAFLDYDNDQDQDLLFVNSDYWPWDSQAASPRRPTLALYRNEGHGRFAEAVAGSGLDVSLYGMGIAVGDYDNDGWVDVFLTAVGSNRLFRNESQGRFRDVTAQAGVAGDTHGWGTSCAWVDIDNDRDLDLFVCHYVRWSREIDFEVGYKIDGVHRAYGQPMNFQGSFPTLYRNNGDGTFTDISAGSGIQVRNKDTGLPVAKSLGVAPIDVDGDGWMDVIVANDTVQNFLFHNQGNETFKEVGMLAGVAFDANGQARGAMGIDAARYRGDAALGIAIGNFANEMTALYVSQGNPLLFTDESIAEGLGPPSRLLLKFGLFFFDYDLDGRLDLLTANGHLEEEISKLQQSQTYAQPAQLFWNAGPNQTACFVPVASPKAGPDLFKPIVGRGSAFADIDGDGDLDVVLTQVHGAPVLLRNDQALENRWIRLKLTGTRSNRDAIGAWIHVRVGPQILSRQVMPTRGYLSQSELPVTIGLGKAEKVDGVEIVWPGGTKQSLDGVPVNQLTILVQPQ